MRNKLGSIIIVIMVMVTLFAMFNQPYGKTSWSAAQGVPSATFVAPPAPVSTSVFLTGKGGQIFQYEDDSFGVYGNCVGDDCELVARFSADNLIDCFALGFGPMGTAEPTVEATNIATTAPAFTCDFVVYEVPTTPNPTVSPTATLDPLATEEPVIRFEGLLIYETPQTPTPTLQPATSIGTTTPAPIQPWYVVVFHLGTDQADNSHIFQVNVYNQADMLVDDTTLIRVRENGVVTMANKNAPTVTPTQS